MARDAADRWLHTRLHCLGASVFGVLAFAALAEAESGFTARGLAQAAVALLQVAMLPDSTVALAQHGAELCLGLSALQRMRQLWRLLVPEELECPMLRVRLPSRREEEDVAMKKAALKERHGIVLGDSVIERASAAPTVEDLYDLWRLEQEQTVSCDGFPFERVPDDWPYFGGLQLENVSVRYSPGATLALSDVSLSIPPSKALLLIGPASCGKTTALRTLLRLCPFEAGSVIVDGVDVRSVGLTTLRGRIAVVPQELTLFHGSWRTNLDPLGEFEEEHLNFALRLTRLQNWLDLNAPMGIDEPLPKAMGPALRALVGLCRALLRLLQKRSKLLILDRTTCALDETADANITALILRFCRRKEAAVLQASRRLTQAALYDHIAVIKGGRIIEQGPPRKLWARDAAFREMARSMGVDAKRLSRPAHVADRLTSVWAWEVNPQEDADWADEFQVAIKKAKPKADKEQ
eukprot:gnl/TRDRNA2_/TRDRNA2_172478_c3_seq1.p1 gnl/TRDRNA2_/TRDRNA2_172478_c3~~gnl/TRDRNA2_/TRDRNA2_172478_c3_seq1.p1  ORF type:complete len:501 (+),score=108.15 gnl/TRDRNA2_/TRDRNA2_172478_c3_seq1:110-1504(+)